MNDAEIGDYENYIYACLCEDYEVVGWQKAVIMKEQAPRTFVMKLEVTYLEWFVTGCA